jgi:hypothetical protein
LVQLQSGELKKELRVGDLVLSQILYIMSFVWLGSVSEATAMPKNDQSATACQVIYSLRAIKHALPIGSFLEKFRHSPWACVRSVCRAP